MCPILFQVRREREKDSGAGCVKGKAWDTKVTARKSYKFRHLKDRDKDKDTERLIYVGRFEFTCSWSLSKPEQQCDAPRWSFFFFPHPEPYSKERKNKNKNKNRAYLYGSVWCRIKLAISLTLRLANPGTGNRHILGDKKETNMLDSNREIALKVAPKPKNFAFPRHAFILVW